LSHVPVQRSCGLAQGLGVIFAAKVGDIDITAMAAAKENFAKVLVSMKLSPILMPFTPPANIPQTSRPGKHGGRACCRGLAERI